MKKVKRPRTPGGILKHELPRSTKLRYGKFSDVVIAYPDGSELLVNDGALLQRIVLLRWVWKNLPKKGAR